VDFLRLLLRSFRLSPLAQLATSKVFVLNYN